MAEEIFDVVNDRDEVIGQAPRGQVHRQGLKHRAVHIFLFDPDGRLFIQKRAATKDTFPGRYDSSASGHVDSGEQYDACAVRELREELGLGVTAEGLRKDFKIDACPQTGQEFVWVYSFQGDYHPVINPAEIERGEFLAVDAVRDLVEHHPDQCAPSFCRIFREAQERGLLSRQ
jgi:isopentenyl-diphosphate delta-isomerase type 1